MTNPLARRVAAGLLALGAAACDPAPFGEAAPPGGYAAPVTATGRAAVRAVLYTPSHGSFRTVREAVSVYMERSTEAVAVHGWIADAVTNDASPYYRVAFAWNDGARERTAEWELDGAGVWPMNNEARVLTVFPPADARDAW